jgi:hypothetical protein
LPGLPIDETDTLPSQVLDPADSLGIAARDNQSFVPARERDHRHVVARELTANERQVEVSAI